MADVEDNSAQRGEAIWQHVNNESDVVGRILELVPDGVTALPELPVTGNTTVMSEQKDFRLSP